VLFHLLLALAAVIALGRLLGLVFRAVGQPPVIGEVIAGIALGPSLLGRLAPEAYRYLVPAEIAPVLGLVAQVGVVLYMFLIGVELNPDLVRRRMHATLATALASVVLPFVLGSMLGVYLYSRLAPPGVPPTHFALFMGVAMAITAFPVLARILSDSGMSRTELGVRALTCAAVNDIAAWCLLALVIGAVHVTGGAVMVVGAFLLGAFVPHDSRPARALERRLRPFVTLALLPAFFAFAGMRTQIDLVAGWSEWLVVALIIGVATVGKVGGTVAGARASGLEWRTAAALGILMNTRGLMELIVLNIGLDLGVISPKLYTMMVLMALATTLATTPALQLVLGSPRARRAEAV
jgi:Kef-type K+ transport system membrane component KefB